MSLRAVYPKRIGPAAIPTGVAASVYQSSERVVIRNYTLANTTSGALNVTLHIVAASGSASVGNQILPALQVPANDTIVVPAPTVLEKGDQIFALASGAVNLMFNVTDRETEVL